MDLGNIIITMNDEGAVAEVMYISGDKSDADIVVVSAGPWSCAAEDLFDGLFTLFVTHVEVRARPDGTMYTCEVSHDYFRVMVVVAG